MAEDLIANDHRVDYLVTPKTTTKKDLWEHISAVLGDKNISSNIEKAKLEISKTMGGRLPQKRY